MPTQKCSNLFSCTVLLQYYERIIKNAGFPYFISAAGGQGLDGFNPTPEPGEQRRCFRGMVPATQVTQHTWCDIRVNVLHRSLVHLSWQSCWPVVVATGLSGHQLSWGHHAGRTV